MKKNLLKAFAFSFLTLTTGISYGQLWTLREPMPEKRVVFSAAAWNHNVYVLGGSNTEGLISDTVLVYNTLDNTWDKAAPIPYPVVEAYAATIGDKIYLVGGFRSDVGSVNNVSIYDPVTDSWSDGATMPTSRAQISGGVIDGKIYITGGYPSEYTALEIYDPETDSWNTGTDIPLGVLQNNGGIVYDNKFHVIGGKSYSGYTFYSTNYQYDPLTDEWVEKAELPENLFAGAAAILNNKIHYFGGSVTNTPIINFDVHYVYDPAADTWATGLVMPEERADHVAVTVGDSIYVIGGFINCDDCFTSTMAITDLNQMYSEPKQQQQDPELSIQDVAKESDILLYPNPCSASFTLLSQARPFVNFTITDITGRVMATRVVNSNSLSFNTQDLPSGTYLIAIEDQGQHTYLRKFLVQH